MGREHWTKGIITFLWNTCVLTHDFVEGYSTKTWSLCKLCIESWGRMLGTYISKWLPCTLYMGAGALARVERREGFIVAVTVCMSRSLAWWCKMGRHWEKVQLVFVFSRNDFTLNEHLRRLLEWAPYFSTAFCSSNGIAVLRGASCFNALINF